MALNAFNEVNVRSKIINSLNAPNYRKFFHNSANTRFIAAKNEMLKDLDDNLVIKELNVDETSKDNSSQIVGGGSLRAFIGFDEKDNPALDLKNYLNENTKMDGPDKVQISSTKNKVTFSWKVTTPSKTQLYTDEKFKAPWGSGTWIKMIETGSGVLGTLAYFIMAKTKKTADRFKAIGSRSGWGLQSKKKIVNGVQKSFKPVKFISTILDNFIARFK